MVQMTRKSMVIAAGVLLWVGVMWHFMGDRGNGSPTTLQLSSTITTSASTASQSANTSPQRLRYDPFKRHKQQILSIHRAKEWQCDTHPALKRMDFTAVEPPVHMFPLPGSTTALPIFAELERNSCNLLGYRGCEKIAGGDNDAPDTWLAQFIEKYVGFGGTNVDFGANLGLVSLLLLQKGGNLIAVEPQLDLCCAARASVEYNNLAMRSVFMCGGVSVSEEAEYGGLLRLSSKLYRYGEKKNLQFDSSQITQKYGLPTEVPMYYIGNLLLGGPTQPGQPTHLNFIKVDTDSVDCDVLDFIIAAVRDGKMVFESLSMETWAGSCKKHATFSKLMFDAQQAGYTLYRACYVSTAKTLNLGDSTARVAYLPYPIFEFKKMTLEEWQGLDVAWKYKTQLLVTRRDDIPTHPAIKPRDLYSN